MKRTDCTICESKDIPINETIRIDGNIYCAACFDVNFSDKKSLESRLVEKELDPTICSSCNNDFGDLELGKISRYPLCSDCEILLRNRTFPFWVKGFLAVLIIIVVSSFIWNWKFYQAYRNIKDANMRFASSN